MRSAVKDILRYNKNFKVERLSAKLGRLTGSPFSFFRGTYHLFVKDAHSQWAKSRQTESRGLVVGDLHTENFGSYRAVTNEIVYDINDFDEATEGFYEWDLKRLTVSLVLAARDAELSFGSGLDAAEFLVGRYLDTIATLRPLRDRKEFAALPETRSVRELLRTASEQSREEMMRKMAQELGPGRFELRHLEGKMLPVPAVERKQAEAALPFYLRHCLSIHGKTTGYVWQDVAVRVAGAGSLGRPRYAVLLGKGEKEAETWKSLRLIEWKQAMDAAWDEPKGAFSEARARRVMEATTMMQLAPKRYLGWTQMGKWSMQAREIGANDFRFNAREWSDRSAFRDAAASLGMITARAHLLGSGNKNGARGLLKELKGREQAWVRHLLAFAMQYAEQVHEDYAEFMKARADVARAWRIKPEKG